MYNPLIVMLKEGFWKFVDFIVPTIYHSKYVRDYYLECRLTGRKFSDIEMWKTSPNWISKLDIVGGFLKVTLLVFLLGFLFCYLGV